MLHRRVTFLPSLASGLVALESQQASAGVRSLQQQHAVISPALQRWYSSEVTPDSVKGEDFVYEAPFAGVVRRVKKLSLFSCACACAAGPLILGLDAGTAVQAKLSIAATLGGFGVFTTGLLHWFVAPYVQRLTYHSSDDSVEVETMSLLVKPKRRTFSMSDVVPSESVHPLSTFAVKGGKYYYLDADNFRHKALLVRLSTEAAEAHLRAAAQAAAHPAEKKQDVQEQAGGAGAQ